MDPVECLQHDLFEIILNDLVDFFLEDNVGEQILDPVDNVVDEVRVAWDVDLDVDLPGDVHDRKQLDVGLATAIQAEAGRHAYGHVSGIGLYVTPNTEKKNRDFFFNYTTKMS